MTSTAIRPRHLRAGDTVAVLSPSWGGPAAFPHVYEAGLDVLRSWGLRIREYPTTRLSPAELSADPRGRARDLTAAFEDPAIAGIVASIGGDDAIRLLPYLDPGVIRANPKILLGYSDATVLLAAVRRVGVVAFHGPSVMAGIGQLPALGTEVTAHIRSMLFEAPAKMTYPAFGRVSEGYPDWRDPANVGRIGADRDAGPWRLLQGTAGPVSGVLEGGCLEVIDWLRGTWAGPEHGDRDGRLLAIETSEELPSPVAVGRMLRSLGVAGVLDGLAGVLIGRWRERTPDEVAEVEEAVLGVIAGEFDRPDLPIVANLPFGHTDPQWVLPLGVRATVDPGCGELRLEEPWLD
jgi:muramoyltetrapeptide carboxypeptidase LdcA involved in peptidoglycan recycling